MKKLLALVFLMLMLVSATDYPEPKSGAFQKSIEGTWELVSFYNYRDGVNISDTTATANGYRQIKMYYNGKVMWTRYVPTDSIEWFGYGSYKNTDSTLTETLEYMSASMRRASDTLSVYNFELKVGDGWYSQISVDAEGQRTFSENYKRLD